MGCIMTVQKEGDLITVEGNQCIKGKNYAIEECTKPTRVLTSSVYVEGGKLPVVPVKTQHAIDKDKLFEVLKLLKHTRCEAPIEVGEVIVENILGLGVDIVATKCVKKQ